MGNQPPLRARLHWYQLSASEFALLTAMCEHCSDGSTIWAAIPRLAAYSKLSERKVQYVLRELCDRGILSQLAPANTWKKRRPAIYRINEPAMSEDSRMAPYRTNQLWLPGVRRTGAQSAPVAVHGLQLTGAQDAPDSRSKSNPNPIEIQHGDAALNSMPVWLAFKEQLRTELSEDEWSLWARPMFLWKAISASADQKHLVAALPPNGRIQSAAMKRLPMMREMLAPAGLNISLTRYPDGYDISEAKRRYGKDITPKPWTHKGTA
jgi:hypothetical protein